MNKRSIAFQLGIYVLGAVIVVISMIVLLNYKHSKKIIMEKIEENAIHQSGLVINQISKNVINNQEIARNVANQALYYYSHGDLDFFLQQVVAVNQVTFGLHVSLFLENDTLNYSSFHDKQGQVVNKQNDKQCVSFIYPDLAERSIKEKKGIWSDPFYCPRDSNTLVISYFLPIFNAEGGVDGLITSDIDLKFLSDAISQIKIHEHGFAFIVSDKGLYLTHPMKEWVMKRNIFEISTKIFNDDNDKYRNLLMLGESGSGFVKPQFLNFEKSWFYFSPIPYTNWRVIIVIPSTELFNELDVVFREIVMVSAIGILLILLVIVLIFNKMLTPLAHVVKSIQRFSFGEKGRKSKKNEIELLNDSLKELQFQYETYLKEQDQSRKDKRKYEKDLKSAKEIQRTIIPPDYEFSNNRKEIDLHAILQPAESIGGDLYDYFFIDANHILFTMGDVSGKGIPAALFMAVAHTMIKSKSTVLSAMHIVDVVNKALSKENSNQHFLTLFLGILDIETGILDYCNAAHNYPFLIRRNKNIIQLEQTHGLPIGVYSNKSYKANSIVLSKGDTIVLYTDGVTDCKNSDGQFYGIDRLSSFIHTIAELTPKELINQLMADLMNFKGNTKQADDISLMAVKFNGKYS